MFHVIPSNQLELLVEPLKYLLAGEKRHVLASDWIILPHRGMQHWLSMELANSPDRKICMNLDMQLPATAIWRLIHRLLGHETNSEAADWQRETLTWRLYNLLETDAVTQNSRLNEATEYWNSGSNSQQAVKRYQLAEQLGDLFEQYLIYRPEWIQIWQKGETTNWQGLLWNMLVANLENSPLELMDKALGLVEQRQHLLPDRLFIFAVNNMAPLWLDFLKELSSQSSMDVHLFYLNPSDEYWADQVSEKRAAQLRANWFEQGAADTVLETGNSLLSSMGAQGQAFINLLSERADTETPLFVDPGQETRLLQLQQDLLLLTNTSRSPSLIDDSISITSAYSPLREVQALHDWLLTQFNEDATLKPRDVLVMCPGIENYAPFIEAVFARGYDHLSENLPPLPCSIADRNLINSDPLVNAFLSFLELPDDRLQVNQIMSWLNVPAIREQFSFSQDSLEKIENWLIQANIHWGLDAKHKSRFIDSDNTNENYTWRLGLQRLLLGFAWGDSEELVDGRLMLPPVEGDDVLILDQLIQFIDQLEHLALTIKKPRTVNDWVVLLRDKILVGLFQQQTETRSFQILENCLLEFIHRANESGTDKTIEGSVVRYYLQQELGRPETTASQYLMGQITFCSMVPMRSVPFKVIAVLGLNEGEYPRQRQNLSLDLMANEPMKLGDRSRRGDDRYLFLETLMSAREKLYLSYQGRNIHNNSEKQPSLLLEELMDFLTQHHGWSRDQIRQIPMQPFSKASYQGDQASFDPVWLQLAVSNGPITLENSVISDVKSFPELNPELMVQFFDHPSAFWAKNQLGLFLQQPEQKLNDEEPFETNHLQRYLVQQELTKALIDSNGDEQQLLNIRQKISCSGQLPDNDLVSEELDSWQQQSLEFYQVLASDFDLDLQPQIIEFEFGEWHITATLPITKYDELQFWRLADAKSKDLLRVWLFQLIAQVGLNKPVISRGLYRSKDGFKELKLQPIPDAESVLADWLALFESGQKQPLLFNAGIAVQNLAKRSKSFQQIWQDSYFSDGLGQDPYIKYFWPEMPEDDCFNRCVEFYEQMIESIEISDKVVAV